MVDRFISSKSIFPKKADLHNAISSCVKVRTTSHRVVYDLTNDRLYGMIRVTCIKSYTTIASWKSALRVIYYNRIVEIGLKSHRICLGD